MQGARPVLGGFRFASCAGGVRHVVLVGIDPCRHSSPVLNPDPTDFSPPPLRIQYGMLEGKVTRVSADATEAPSANTRPDALSGRDRPMGPLAYRALVELKSQVLRTDKENYPVASGMQVAGELHLGTRSIIEYLLSPVRKAWHEAARER